MAPPARSAEAYENIHFATECKPICTHVPVHSFRFITLHCNLVNIIANVFPHYFNELILGLRRHVGYVRIAGD